MKKIPLISFLFCAIISLSIFGCGQPEPGPDPEQSDITIGHVPVIPVEGGTFEVDIQYNTEFTVEVEESAQSWITFVQVKAPTAGKLEFRFEPNDGIKRTGIVTVKAVKSGTEPIKLSFVQKEGLEKKIRKALMEIYDAMDGKHWTSNQGWGTKQPINEWDCVEYHEEDGTLRLVFNGVGLKGEFPDVFEDLTSCVSFTVQSEPDLTGTLPQSFGKLTKLKELLISHTSMTGLPDIFGDLPLKSIHILGNKLMTDPLPESLCASDGLMEDVFSNGIPGANVFIAANGFTGDIPESYLRLGTHLALTEHKFSGQIPDYFYSAEEAGYLINMYISGGQTDQEYRKAHPFSVKDVDIPGFWPKREIKDILTGKPIPYNEIVSSGKATVIYKWASWCAYSATLLPQLKRMYEKYHDAGLDVILRQAWGDEEGDKILVDYLTENGYDIWHNYSSEGTSLFEENAIGSHGTPFATVLDNKGNIIYTTTPNVVDPARGRFGHLPYFDLIPFLEDIFGPLDDGEVYTSTDYSMDGQVRTLQTASVGNGINIVFMGDAYTDKFMNDGMYDFLMSRAMEEFFNIEPYKTFRDRFNVYSVKVVSANERTGDGYSTAFGTNAGPASISISDTGVEKCYEYALKVPEITNKSNLLIGVLINSTGIQGITAMSESLQSGVAFFSSGSNVSSAFGSTVRHEAGGHGFAFLADEYGTQTGSPSQDLVDEYNRLYNAYGWYSNVDFTNDPAAVRWSAFLADDRYKNEVGVFEGGALYSHGAYRPSQNSMMRDNLEYFNAPSRWAIYKRIMELSGESYSFETFLDYDKVNRL